MARPGITYAEVVAVIDTIIANGDEPTIQRIRDHLGTGSPNTIHRHLTAWRASRPLEQRKAPELPADLQAALVREIERQAAEERAEVEKALVSSQQEAETLSKAGEELEAANADLEEQNEALSVERERLTALAEERHTEIEELKADLERERKAAEEARIQVAQARNKIESLEQQVEAQAEKLVQALADTKAAESAQVAADKSAAVAEAKLESERSTVADLRERLTVAQTQIKTDTDRHANELADVRAQFKADIEDRVKALNVTNSELMTALKKVGDLERELAEQKRQVDLEHAENKRLKSELSEFKKSGKTGE